MMTIPFFHYFYPMCFMAVIAINAARLVSWMRGEGWDF